MPPILSRRRNFLKLVGAGVGVGVAPAWATPGDVSLLLESGGPAAGLAARHLARTLKAHGVTLRTITDLKSAKGFVIIAAMPQSPLAAGFAPPAAGWASPDCLRLVPGMVQGKPALLLSATDTRGFV